VLGPADLQLGIEGDGSAGCVRSRAALTPVGAGYEVHRLGLAACFAIALDPEQGAVGRGHGDHHARVGRIVDQQPADDGKCRGQRVGGAHVVKRGADRCRPRPTAVGVDAGGQAAAPTLGDHGSQLCRVEIDLACDEEFMNGAQIRQPSRGPAARGRRSSH
jgi:hypothetical protein